LRVHQRSKPSRCPTKMPEPEFAHGAHCSRVCIAESALTTVFLERARPRPRMTVRHSTITSRANFRMGDDPPAAKVTRHGVAEDLGASPLIP